MFGKRFSKNFGEMVKPLALSAMTCEFPHLKSALCCSGSLLRSRLLKNAKGG
jgi:hypothetical protein